MQMHSKKKLRSELTLILLVIIACTLTGAAQQVARNDSGATPKATSETGKDESKKDERGKPQDVPKIRDAVVITASGREESLSQISTTVQILDRESIENSTAATITQFLSDNGIAFFSTWTPGQTSMDKAAILARRLSCSSTGGAQALPTFPNCLCRTSNALKSCAARPRCYTVRRRSAA